MKFLTIIILLGMLCPILIGKEFKSLKTDYAAKARFVERLTEVKLTEVRIDKINLSSAVSQICRGSKQKGEAAIVNYVILFPTRENEVDPFSDNPIEKGEIDPLVSYQGVNVSFTTVLDSLCLQAGYRWSVADDEDGNSFILIE